ncbi:Crotonobetainyl-CoA:carnitine CoA-transferase CaiB [Roseovarius azorensis]|uniref:Crotonobetainyl-CoA:carnitine CoA-transferase CaiB n=1 Tax=Roseovarius azorensis TaxID=1287727 RepID=A0A1H7JVX0_9RHOB|nr:CaiB/BaiF CoA-transferase family protein [Roseovarius azorensis]SEK77887.1 Crotonobetainyl-CoA:carnitine CoA-transferase CaiB [Roseovarius azorensis]
MLSGLIVVEIEGLGPAPFAGMMLAELGAEVIVIHRPGRGNSVAAERNLLDRGKRSIILDLKDAGDLAVAQALVARADALIEGFRPGVMERLGLGPEEMRQANPRLVYGRMTGWGQDGPRAMTAGHDLNYIATSGALWYAGAPGTPPVAPPTLVGDVGGGALYLVAGVLAGLIRAAREGRGCVVDAAIVDGSAHMMALLTSMMPSGHLSMQRGQSLLDGPHWSRVYRCQCGGYLSVQCLESQFYAEFLRRMELADDPRFADQHDREAWAQQSAALDEIFAQHPVVHWAGIFAGSDACVAPVLRPDEAADDPHMQARGVWRTSDGHLNPAPAPRFDGRVSDIALPPERGAHSAQIRAWLRDQSSRRTRS